MKKITKNTPSHGEIILYKTDDGHTQIDVRLEEETVWLSQAQMTQLFSNTKQNISLHINNIFKEGELNRASVVKESLTTAKDGKIYKTQFFNLDVIISVGYRVKSKQGTRFRIWATKTLREHLINGYTINELRLKKDFEKYSELKKTIDILSRVVQNKELTSNESTGLLTVISDYSLALDILDSYDYQTLTIKKTTKKESFIISYDSAKETIKKMKERYGSSELFGKEKDESFKSSVATIYQTFGKKELYPSIEEKGANLLYLTIKNHSFIDGNKRIAASLFLWYLQQNNCLYRPTGEKRIADNALVALCLMIAQSNPKEKDVMIKVIVNLINKNN